MNMPSTPMRMIGILLACSTASPSCVYAPTSPAHRPGAIEALAQSMPPGPAAFLTPNLTKLPASFEPAIWPWLQHQTPAVRQAAIARLLAYTVHDDIETLNPSYAGGVPTRLWCDVIQSERHGLPILLAMLADANPHLRKLGYDYAQNTVTLTRPQSWKQPFKDLVEKKDPSLRLTPAELAQLKTALFDAARRETDLNMVAAAQNTLFACRESLGKNETLNLLMTGPDGTPNSLPIAHVYLLATVYDGEERHLRMGIFLPRIRAQLRQAPQGETRALLELMNLLDDGTQNDGDLVLAKANAFPHEPGVQIQAWKWLLAHGDNRSRLLVPRLAPMFWQNCYDSSLDILPNPRTANALVEAWKLNIETNTFHNHEAILRNLAKAAGGDATIVQRLRDLAPESSPKNARLDTAQAAWFITHDRQPLLHFLEDELAGKHPDVCNEYDFDQHCRNALAELDADEHRGERAKMIFDQEPDEAKAGSPETTFPQKNNKR